MDSVRAAARREGDSARVGGLVPDAEEREATATIAVVWAVVSGVTEEGAGTTRVDAGIPHLPIRGAMV